MLLISKSAKTLFLLVFLALAVTPAYGADGAYMVFMDGKEAKIRDGYKSLMSAMRDLKKTGKTKKVVEVNLDGNSFFIDVAQLAVLCKEPCRSFQVVKRK